VDFENLRLAQFIIHYSLHLFFPWVLAFVFYKSEWKRAYFLFLLTMLVDLDHLLATPIFDPNRCSIGFHYLHSYYAIFFYGVLLFYKNRTTRIIAIGLLLHMATDYQDCLWNSCIESHAYSYSE
jgi:hypothetical protein